MAKRFLKTGEEVLRKKAQPDGFVLLKLRQRVWAQEPLCRTYWMRMRRSEYEAVRLPLRVQPSPDPSEPPEFLGDSV